MAIKSDGGKGGRGLTYVCMWAHSRPSTELPSPKHNTSRAQHEFCIDFFPSALIQSRQIFSFCLYFGHTYTHRRRTPKHKSIVLEPAHQIAFWTVYIYLSGWMKLFFCLFCYNSGRTIEQNSQRMMVKSTMAMYIILRFHQCIRFILSGKLLCEFGGMANWFCLLSQLWRMATCWEAYQWQQKSWYSNNLASLSLNSLDLSSNNDSLSKWKSV